MLNDERAGLKPRRHAQWCGDSQLWRRGFSPALILLAVLGAACRQDMHNAPRVDPYEETDAFADGRGMRPLVEGTVARGHLNDDELMFTREGGRAVRRSVPVPGDAPGAGARARAVQHLLFALPRPHGDGQRHDRAARPEAAAVVPRREDAQPAGRLLLRRDHQRLRRDAGLPRPGGREGPLGDHLLHPRPAVQPARNAGRRARGQAPRAGRSGDRSRTRPPRTARPESTDR